MCVHFVACLSMRNTSGSIRCQSGHTRAEVIGTLQSYLTIVTRSREYVVGGEKINVSYY